MNKFLAATLSSNKRIFFSTGCEDVIDECQNLEPRDCYYEYYAKACCKTCRALVQNPSDDNCLYGDKGTGCSDMVPEICHLSTRFCCQTCAALKSLKTQSDTTTDNSATSVTTGKVSPTSAIPGRPTTAETILYSSKTATLIHWYWTNS